MASISDLNEISALGTSGSHLIRRRRKRNIIPPGYPHPPSCYPREESEDEIDIVVYRGRGKPCKIFSLYEMALKFAPFASEIELPFYSALSALKIDHDRLDAPTRHVLGNYEAPISVTEKGCRLQILGNALTSTQVPAGYIRAEGVIKNFNTIEEFKTVDYNGILHRGGKQIWDAIIDGTIYSVPSLLSYFTILSFADLKKYKFTYWFAFPALHSDPQWLRDEMVGRLTSAESTALVDRVGTWRMGVDIREHGFFLAKKDRTAPQVESERPETPEFPGDKIGFQWEIASLREFENGFFKDVDLDDQYISFVDPSTFAEDPGWMLRNLLILIRHRFRLNKTQILCYRDVHSRRHEARSIILKLESAVNVDFPSLDMPALAMPKVTGWERNPAGKLSARMTNLAQYMDPERLANQSVDLNLKLMKWRVAPDLALDNIKQAKCLLLGAGTLGSYVSRILQGWNVRKITFVDNATVSFSNPVRQPLFEYADCLSGGAKKALRAAEVLKKIYPGADSSGYVMSVPMLGHPITDEAATKKDFEQLQKLIDEHDAIFLLMDTRESRWLPTLMGKAAGKIVMNAALGFDTYVAMRHGVAAADGGEAALGCYFCNDVVAPADSIKDQTLDQQCTVTRPGIAAIASATLVELFVSVLQHPLRGLAPAPKQSTNSTSSSLSYDRDPMDHPLGIIPHQIRGFLSSFQNKIISGKSYDCCSACSAKVVEAYNKEGWHFVKHALTEKDYVTELSGLAEVQRRAEAAEAELEWDDEGDMGGEGETVL